MYPKIYGFNKSSEAGPDNFAPSVFLGGCNFRCDYCMNAKLVLEFGSLPEISIETVKQFVKENNCEWINISGGEITVHPESELIHMLVEMRKWGCKIAISTNGFMPDSLLRILPLTNYVTMDIKTGQDKYDEIVHAPLRKGFSANSNILKSLYLIRMHQLTTQLITKDFDYELRTTMYRPMVGESEIEEIGMLLRRDEKWILQPFRQAKCMIGDVAHEVEPYTEEEMGNLLKLARKYSDKAIVRYV